MAKKQTLGRADGPAPLTDYKLAQLCREWCRLEDERLELQTQMYARAKLTRAIEEQLAGELRRTGETLHTLPKFEFGFERVKGSMFYKQALIDELGLEEFERRQAALPLKEKFFLREKAPPKPRRRAA